MRSNLRKKLDNLYDYIENTYRAYARTKSMKRILKQMDGGNKNFDDRYAEYLEYWGKYGKKPNKMWLRIYSKDEEGFTPRYIPDSMWFGEIIPYFSNMNFRRAYEDKCFHNILFPMFNRPKTITKCMAGLYYNQDNCEITEEEALELILNSEEAIIKPSIDSGTGRLIEFYDKKEDTVESLKEKLSHVGQNYIVQEIVKQHELLKSVNPKSLNTIRIITFNFGGEIHILSAIFRMGAGEAKIDNVSSGGLQVTLDKYTGEIITPAMDTKRRIYQKHPNTGFEFLGFKIPKYDEILDCVKIGASRLPHFKIIGWDFAVDKDERPIFIEYNTCPDQNQMTAGPTFGDLTEKVLDEIFITQRFKNSQN